MEKYISDGFNITVLTSTFELEAFEYVKQQIAVNEGIKSLRSQHQADLDADLAGYGEFETNGALACVKLHNEYFQQDCMDTLYEIVNKANGIFNVELDADDFINYIQL